MSECALSQSLGALLLELQDISVSFYISFICEQKLSHRYSNGFLNLFGFHEGWRESHWSWLWGV
jgi:hypothetical protein